MNDVDPGWYVLRVHEDELTVFERVRDAGFDAFLPFIWALRGKDRKAVPLYPRYLFARQNALWGRLGRIDGVSYILGGENPGIVPAEFIRDLDWKMALHGGAIMPEHVEASETFAPNDPVRITTGAWAGLMGRFQTRQNGRGRILLDFLGGVRTVSIPLHHLAPLVCAPPAA